MAYILYRETATPIVPSSTAAKGTPLTNSEVDANFKSLDNDIQSRVPITSTYISFDLGNGIVSSKDFNTTSDASLKDNVTPIDPHLIDLINPVKFNWKDTGKVSYGVLAQELEQVMPELVNERSDGTKQVSYIPIIALLVDAVHRLTADVRRLEDKINNP